VKTIKQQKRKEIKMNDKLKYLTRTAMLLALTVIFQFIGRFIPLGPNSNFIVGPLVNACLIISAGLVGLFSGTVYPFWHLMEPSLQVQRCHIFLNMYPCNPNPFCPSFHLNVNISVPA